MRWKLVGLAGLAGVTATGVAVARRRREHRDYDADELRARLHERLRSPSAAPVDVPPPVAERTATP